MLEKTMPDRNRPRAVVYFRSGTLRWELSFRRKLELLFAKAILMNISIDASSADLDVIAAGGLQAYKDVVVEGGITGAKPADPDQNKRTS
jgi:hypothetical protein